MQHHEFDEPYIIVERKSADLQSLLVGVLIGAGVALLFAPASGEETRRTLKRKADNAANAARDMADDVTSQVVSTYESARTKVDEQISSARNAIVNKKRQVSRAMEAGRDAAQQAREELELQLAETKAAYRAGAQVSRSGRADNLTSSSRDAAI